MRVADANFTVHGTPSEDGYGGTFEYTNPAPLTASVSNERKSPTLAVGLSPLCIAFCVAMNIGALMLVLPKGW